MGEELRREVGYGELRKIEMLLAQGADVNKNWVGALNKYSLNMGIVTKQSFSGISDDVNVLWDDLVENQYIDENGCILRRFREQTENSSSMQLSLKDNGQKEKVYEILKQHNLVKFFLDRGADVNARGLEGRTILMVAAEHGRPDIVHMLLKKGADVNAQDERQATALMIAAEHENWEAVKILLDNNADIAKEDFIGRTALMYAVAKNNDERQVVLELLKRGVDPNARDDEGRTALIQLARYGHADMMQALLEHGANVRMKDQYGESALEYVMGYSSKARDSKKARLLQLALAESVFSPVYTGNIDADLLEAAERDKIKVEELLQKGADANISYLGGKTALMVAAYYGNSDIVRILLDNRAEIEKKDQEGKTALLIAVQRGFADIVQILVDRGANISGKDQQHRSALWIAVEEENFDVVRILLNNGADVNATNLLDKETALHAAVRKNNIKIVTLLLEHGADVHAKTQNQTALMLAGREKYKDIVDLLLKNGADPEDFEGWE